MTSALALLFGLGCAGLDSTDAGRPGGSANDDGSSGGSGGSLSSSGGSSGLGGGAGGLPAATGGAGTGGTGTGGAATGGGPAVLGPATVWIAGDSTVANGGASCPIGWGKSFDALFDERITVVNSAVGGRSVRTWLYDVQATKDSGGECVLTLGSDGKPALQARWQAMLDGMQEGDFLLIQFGINDGDSACPRHVGVEAFKASYSMMVEAAQARGTQPVLLTPVSAIACTGSVPHGTRGFVDAVKAVGLAYDVPVIDLHALSVALYAERGFCPIPGGGDISAATGGDVGEFFCADHTHFDTVGAAGIAEVVAGALAGAGVSLSEYLL